MVIVTSEGGGFVRLFGDGIDIKRESGVFGLGKVCIDCMETEDHSLFTKFPNFLLETSCRPKILRYSCVKPTNFKSSMLSGDHLPLPCQPLSDLPPL